MPFPGPSWRAITHKPCARRLPQRVARRLALACTASVLIAASGEAQTSAPPQPPRLPSLPVPSSYEGLFAERDARAREALAFLTCMEQTARAAASRRPTGAGESLACIREGNEWRGVVATLTEAAPGARVVRQFAMRGTAVPVSLPIDTAAVSRIVRALRRGVAAPLPAQGPVPFAPVALAQPTFTEVWFLPLPSLTRLTVGGDSVIQMTTDGMRELGHASRTPPIRTVAAPAAGPLVIESSADRLPLVSELLAAHVALPTVGEVRIRGRDMESVLVRGGTWTHTAKR